MKVIYVSILHLITMSENRVPHSKNKTLTEFHTLMSSSVTEIIEKGFRRKTGCR